MLRTPLMIATSLVLLAGNVATAQTASQPLIVSDASAHLEEIIRVLRNEWLFRDNMNWPAFRLQVLAKAGNARTIPEAYDAVRLALRLLGDRHSHYTTADGQRIWNPQSPTQSTNACTPAPFSVPPLPPNVGYLRVRITPQTPIKAIQAVLREGALKRIDRWILDLRNSRGGNMWPALAGLGPLVGEGIAGYFIDKDGRATPWGYTSGRAWSDTVTVVRATKPVVLPVHARVAVLTDVGVASSGEAIAIAFRSRPNTRSFGTATCGISTAVGGVRLANGATLGFVTAFMADRTRRKYGGPVVPDEVIADPAEALLRALEWVRQ